MIYHDFEEVLATYTSYIKMQSHNLGFSNFLYSLNWHIKYSTWDLALVLHFKAQSKSTYKFKQCGGITMNGWTLPKILIPNLPYYVGSKMFVQLPRGNFKSKGNSVTTFWFE